MAEAHHALQHAQEEERHLLTGSHQQLQDLETRRVDLIKKIVTAFLTSYRYITISPTTFGVMTVFLPEEMVFISMCHCLHYAECVGYAAYTASCINCDDRLLYWEHQNVKSKEPMLICKDMAK